MRLFQIDFFHIKGKISQRIKTIMDNERIKYNIETQNKGCYVHEPTATATKTQIWCGVRGKSSLRHRWAAIHETILGCPSIKKKDPGMPCSD